MSVNDNNDSQSTSSSPLLNNRSPRVRSIPRPVPSLFNLLTFPFQIGYRLIWTILSFVVNIFPLKVLFPSSNTRSRRSSRQSRMINDPQAAASRFVLDFEQSYGSTHPEFFNGTYSQALAVAKREFRVLLAILQCDEHDDTDSFCRKVLCSEEFVNFISAKNILVWGGNVAEVEAFQVANILSVTSYPFMAMIALQRSQMTILERIEGLVDTERVINKLNLAFERIEPDLAVSRNERRERERAREIRQQQDLAYQSSLLADQEKEKAEKEKQLAQQQKILEQERLETLRRKSIKEKEKKRQFLIDNLPAEPSAEEPETTKLSIRLPNGDRLVRRFRATDTLQSLSDFVFTQDLNLELEYDIVNTFPRKVFNDLTLTIKEVGLYPSGAVIVEERD